MNKNIQMVCELLENKGVHFNIVEHDAVYTIDEMVGLNLPHTDSIAKNLFLRDDKKRNYYLLVVRGDKKVELKSLKEKISSRPLSFASENDLNAILKLTKGSVTPMGIINDEQRKVKIIFDESFRESLIGVHPNDNTATVWLQTTDLITLLKQYGNSVSFVAI